MKKLTVLLWISLTFLTCLFSQNYNNTLRSTMNFPGQNLANIAGYWQDGREYALVGASKGLVIVDITDPTSPVQIGQYTGPDNRWKEIKTYKQFAYVTTEGGSGFQIFDLSNLPNPNVPNKFYTGTSNAPKALTNIHALHIDTTAGFLYGFGGNYSGASIHDLNADPYNPTYVGQYQGGGYIHDGYVDNDTMYACHIYAGRMEIVDMRNKSNPQLLGGVTTPNAFTHNAWLLPGNKHILTTDERSNSWLACYDISDPTDIFEVDRMQTTPGSGSIVHNTHVTGHYAVSSWYRDGYNIVDAFRPNNIVQVGAYDTWPQADGSGFQGCWGVYPFFPSGTIIASNMNPAELLILTPDYKQACYVEGTVIDACTGLDISGARIRINHTDPLFETTSNNNGIFRTGQPTAGDFIVTVESAGYITQTFDVTLAPHQVVNLSVQLQKVGTVTQLPSISLCQNDSVVICGTAFRDAGTYTATCIDQNGCDSILEFTILPKIQAEIIGQNSLTCDNPTLSLDYASTAGFAEWFDPAGTPIQAGQSLTVNEAGTYTLIVEGSGCVEMDTLTVFDNTAPPSLAVAGGMITCATPSVNLNVTSNDPTASYTWSAANGFSATGASVATSQSGTYTVHATNPFGCSASESIVVGNDVQAPDIQSVTGGTLDCNTNSVMLTITSVTATDYAWTSPSGNLLGTTSSITTSMPGTYTVTAFAANGCSSTATTTVADDAAIPDVRVEDGGVITCVQSFWDLVAISQTAGVSYLWDNGDTGDVTLVNTAGNYTVTVTAPNGCTNVATGTVLDNTTPPNVLIDGGVLDCGHPMVTLVASSTTPNTTFTWGGTNTLPNLTINTAGTYTVTATDNSNGCTSTTSETVIEDITQPAINVTDGTLTCAVSTIGITASSTTPNVSYQWSGGQTDATIFVNAAGTYAVTATGANGCTSEAMSTVSGDTASPDLEIITGGDLTCAIQTVDVFAQSNVAVDYAWTGPNGFTSSQSGFGVSDPGLYCVIVTDANGCTAEECVTIVEDTTLPDLEIIGNTTITCSGADLTAQTSVSGSYAWDGPFGQISTQQTISVSVLGTYCVTFTDIRGCTAVECVTLDSDPNAGIPDASAIGGSLNCINTSVTLMGGSTTQGVSFEWFDSNGVSISTDMNTMVSAAGDYTLVVTNPVNGCTIAASTTIDQDLSTPAFSINGGGVLNCSAPVHLNINPPTNNTNFEWIWPDGTTSLGDTLAATISGTYTVIGTNISSGCTSSEMTDVMLNTDVPVLSMPEPAALNCCNSEVQLLLEISSSSISAIEWTGPNGLVSLMQQPLVSEPGTYTVVVTNDFGCTSSLNTTVEAFLETPSIMASGGTLTCTMPTVILDAETNVMNPIFQWTGANGFTSMVQNPTVDMEGTYIVVVEDPLNCCSASASVIVVDSCTVSIVDLEKEGNIKVYPNATTGLLNIESLIPTTRIDGIMIFDAAGKVVRQQDIDSQEFIQLDLSNEADGTYVVRLLSDGLWWSVQVVLMR